MVRDFLPLALVLSVASAGCEQAATAPQDNAKSTSAQSKNQVQGATPAPSQVGAAGVTLLPGDDPTAVDNPTLDGWDSESFSDAAKKQLNRLAELLIEEKPFDPKAAAALVTPDFQATACAADQLAKVYHDRQLSVWRSPAEGNRPAKAANPPRQSVRQLAEQLVRLGEPFAALRQRRVYLKIVAVEIKPHEARTTVRLEAAGRDATGWVSVNATWQCRWVRDKKAAKPRLASVVCEQIERSVLRGSDMLLSDCTADVLADVPQDVRDQFAGGNNYWRARIRTQFRIQPQEYRGLAVGDANGDGLDDVYVCQAAGLPNRLLLQTPSGRVQDASAAAGVDWLDPSRSALFVDLDNDGDQDLVLTLGGAIVVSENDGQARFTKRAYVPSPGGDPYSLAAADFDQDGKLDVYVCCYAPVESRGTFVPYDSNNGGANMLLANRGDWKFVDVAAGVGLGENNRRWSFAAAWEDVDNDGDLDLYVANDYGRNNLYLCQDGRFHDAAKALGVEDMAFGMSVSFADYDNNGWMDLYVGNMFSSAGGRIIPQTQFMPKGDSTLRDKYLRMARGNTLFKNRGDGTFQDVSMPAGVTMGRWAYASPFVDLNNDGREDLLVANGFITNSLTKDL